MHRGVAKSSLDTSGCLLPVCPDKERGKRSGALHPSWNHPETDESFRDLEQYGRCSLLRPITARSPAGNFPDPQELSPQLVWLLVGEWPGGRPGGRQPILPEEARPGPAAAGAAPGPAPPPAGRIAPRPLPPLLPSLPAVTHRQNTREAGPERCPDPNSTCRNASFGSSSHPYERKETKVPMLTSLLLLCSRSLSLWALQRGSWLQRR